MMMVSINTMFASCVTSIIIGFLMSTLAGRLRRRVRGTTEIVCANGPSPGHDGKDVERFALSIYELSAQVDSQVGLHTQKVGEITSSLSGSEVVGSALVLVAGKMLITANQQLQSDLDEAKKELQKQREEMTSCLHESRTDPLTNIANRRALDLELAKAFANRRGGGATFSLLIIDIDHFKRINDNYGHMVGDQLLKCFSRCLTNTFRDSDFVARFGGEEFVAILRKTSLDDACKAAERVRVLISANRYQVGDLEIQLTASIGIKEVGEDETVEEVLQSVDDALYSAKNLGRNCSCFHDGNAIQPVALPPRSDLPDEVEPSEASIEHSHEAITTSVVNTARPSKKTAAVGFAEKQGQKSHI